MASILETVADRSALEQVFHDVKEVHGASSSSCVMRGASGAWNLIGWWHTLGERWAWDRPQSRLRDRSDSPWDQPERRPSHANRCQELRPTLTGRIFVATVSGGLRGPPRAGHGETSSNRPWHRVSKSTGGKLFIRPPAALADLDDVALPAIDPIDYNFYRRSKKPGAVIAATREAVRSVAATAQSDAPRGAVSA